MGNLRQLNTCYPARIVSFDATRQTATVKPVLQGIFSNLYEAYVEDEEQPNLVDVPCHFPRGGGHSITMPVAVGDECLIFFCQRGYDHWKYEGLDKAEMLNGLPSPEHIRSYSRSDAIALIGFGAGLETDAPTTVKDFNKDAIEIRNEDRTQRITLDVATKNIEVVTDADILATSKNITSTSENATVEATTLITLKAPNIKLDGDVDVTGYLKGSDGIDLIGHTHAKGSLTDSHSAPLASGSTAAPQ